MDMKDLSSYSGVFKTKLTLSGITSITNQLATITVTTVLMHYSKSEDAKSMLKML